MTKCSKCKKNKDEKCFAWNNKSLGKRSRRCKECQKIYSQKHYQNNKNPYLKRSALKKKERINFSKNIKESSVCCDCKKYFKYFQMQFDHLPGTNKKNTISKIVQSGTIDQLKKEMKKCEIVCVNCHAKRTFNRTPRSPHIKKRKHLEEKKEWIKNIKEASSCKDCNRYYAFFQMHFDHLPKYKKISKISKMMHSSKKKLKAEIEKCDLVCGNCHAYRTWKRLNKKSSSKS